MEARDVTEHVAIGCRHDVPELAALARETLPSFPALHDEDGWDAHYRFGAGLHPRDSFLPVVRSGSGDGELVAFVWVDAAAAADHGIVEPWWCINALSVAPKFRRQGFGRALVGAVAARAQEAGVELLYGLSVPSATRFWQACGLSIAGDGEALVSDRPSRRADGTLSRVHFDVATPGDRWFVGRLAPASATQSTLVALSELDAEPLA